MRVGGVTPKFPGSFPGSFPEAGSLWLDRVQLLFNVYQLAFARSSRRQGDFAYQERAGGLRPNSVFIWFDFTQNITLPIASVETGDMFYGTDRMEVSCFGVHLVQSSPSGTTVKHIVLVSDIIEHGALFATTLLNRRKDFIDDFEQVAYITMWADCGLHFRSSPFIGQVYTHWYKNMRQGALRLNWFAEKHGKGLVDTLFSTVRGWLANKQKEKDVVLKTVDDLTETLRAGASKRRQLDPHGPTYHIAQASLRDEDKPAHVYEFAAPGFQVSKTYCLEMRPPPLRPRDPPEWVNAVFSDVCERRTGALSSVSVVHAPLPRHAAGQWRRGYYTNKRWDAAPPEHGSKFTLKSRWESQRERENLGESLLTP